VIVSHGFKGFKDWGFLPHLCRKLAGAGHTVVSFDFSRNGVGASGGEVTELERFASNTLTVELEDLLYVLEDVLDRELLPRAPRRVGLLGYGRGGAQSILSAAEEPRVAALVTWAAPSHFDRWSNETRGAWREAGRVWVLNQRSGRAMPLDVTLLDDFERNRERLDVRSAARRVAAPWLIVHGEEDVTVYPEDARELVRHAGSGRLVTVAGAGHTLESTHPFEGESPPLRQAVEATVAHFARHLA